MQTRLPAHNHYARSLAACVAVAAASITLPAHGQSVCSSDGQAQPQALMERFVNAECDTCWSDPATPPAPKEALALDWIVPSPLGDAAALSAAASRDALLGGYLGASIELTLAASDLVNWPLQTWLVLVEALPTGVADSPVPRNLVRNVLQPLWNKGNTLLISEQLNFKEMRALNIPEGANPQRLRVVGWVQDAGGKILTTAESSCPPEE